MVLDDQVKVLIDVMKKYNPLNVLVGYEQGKGMERNV
jgi:hypothetical protein